MRFSKEKHMTKSVKIIHKTEDFIVVRKPVGMPSQSDPTKDPDVMSECSKILSESGETDGLWLVHRLDRNVGGLLVFARTKKAAAALSELAANGKMGKKYLAVAEGEVAGGEYRDYLYKDSATSKAYVVKSARMGAKEAVLNCSLVAFKEGKSLVSVSLKTGRFHQIRVQLSSRKHPLVGDKKYGSRDPLSKNPALFAYELSFEIFGEKISVRALPPTEEYPWSLFASEIHTFEE